MPPQRTPNTTEHKRSNRYVELEKLAGVLSRVPQQDSLLHFTNARRFDV